MLLESTLANSRGQGSEHLTGGRDLEPISHSHRVPRAVSGSPRMAGLWGKQRKGVPRVGTDRRTRRPPVPSEQTSGLTPALAKSPPPPLHPSEAFPWNLWVGLDPGHKEHVWEAQEQERLCGLGWLSRLWPSAGCALGITATEGFNEMGVGRALAPRASRDSSSLLGWLPPKPSTEHIHGQVLLRWTPHLQILFGAVNVQASAKGQRGQGLTILGEVDQGMEEPFATRSSCHVLIARGGGPEPWGRHKRVLR